MNLTGTSDGNSVVASCLRAFLGTQFFQISFVVYNVVLRHGISRRNEIAAMKGFEAAVSVIHHHEHLLGVTTRAQNEQVVLMEVDSLVKSSLLAALEVAAVFLELDVTDLNYVRVTSDTKSIHHLQ